MNNLYYKIFGLIVLLILVAIILVDWNDQNYFKTLDKLTCEEIWTLMTTQGTDWDTTNYYGDRC